MQNIYSTKPFTMVMIIILLQYNRYIILVPMGGKALAKQKIYGNKAFHVYKECSEISDMTGGGGGGGGGEIS